MKEMNSKRLSKPLPYLEQGDSDPMKKAAKLIRKKFAPLIQKRMPSYAHAGWKYGHIPQWVQKHKKDYPCFLKLDIAKFYPSAQHTELMVETQMAYKKLLVLHYVPSNFKKEVLLLMRSFYESLPIRGHGLPLNSAMSKTLEPLMLLPFFLEEKSNIDVKCMVFADDVLLLGRNKKVLEDVYFRFVNHLTDLNLQVNHNKVQSGRFASDVLDFCGFLFAGGTVGISDDKVEASKGRICLHCSKNKAFLNERALIKSVNSKISAFAHFY